MEETGLKLLSWCRCNGQQEINKGKCLCVLQIDVCRLPGISHFRVTQSLCFEMSLKACINGDGGPQLGVVTCVGGVTRLFL